MSFPEIRGWVPFKGLEHQRLKNNENKNESENNDEKLNQVDIPQHWKPDPFKIEDNPNKRLFAVSEFTVLYPKPLDKYLQEILPVLKKSLQEHHVKVELSVLDGEITVKTTPKTFDPVILLKAHSVIKVLARYVPIEDALPLLEEDIYEDIVLIGHNKKDTFIKRRSRIDNDEMKELIKEVLECKIFVSGKSAVVIGSYSNLHRARTLITECFEKNIHPIYHMKRFQIMNKLAILPEMEKEDWSKYLPPIPKKKNVKRKAPTKVRETKEYTPFAPPNMESKKDKELESGIFHLKYSKDGANYYKKIKNDNPSAKKGKYDKNSKNESSAKKRKLDDDDYQK